MNSRIRALEAIEVLFLGFAVLSLQFISGYLRPTFFFVFVMGFDFAMIVEATDDNKESMLLYAAKLVLGQVIFAGSFMLLYPGFVSTDGYRDYLIASSVITHGGGLPSSIGGNLWYDFSPMVPLNYAIGSLMSGVPLRLVELSSGISYLTLIMVSVGAITKRITSDFRLARTAMVLSTLFPLLNHFTTWPIPGILAVSLVLPSIIFLLKNSTGATLAGPIILGLAIILTHGGVSIEFIAIVISLYFANRSKAILRLAFVMGVSLISYNFLVFISGVQSGVLTIWAFILNALTLSGPAAASGIAVGSNWADTALANYPLVLIAALSWVGFSLVLLRRSDYRSIAITLTVIAGVTIILGLLTSSVIHTENGALFYLGLVGFPLISIPASIGMVPLLRARGGKGILLWFMLIVLTISAVTYVGNSPDFWQGTGNQAYAANGRLGSTTTWGEQAGQLFLNRYDIGYYVQSNFILASTNITGTDVYYSIGIPQHGWVVSLPVGLAGVILISTRAIALGTVVPYRPPTYNLSRFDLVYYSSSSEAFYVPK